MTTFHHLHQQWTTPAMIVEWLDGDTVDVIAEVLPYDWQIKRVRVAAINAPEMKTGKPGSDAKMFALSSCPPNSIVRLTSTGKDAFGRLLAEVRYGGSVYGREDHNLGEEMVKAGQAVYYGKAAGLEFQP